MKEYRVNLDVYNGPLDLLLWLIRREEVDIYDIPIARVTEQYLQYVELIHRLDPNLAGDFLVLAATLMEIKTRMLLPTPAVDDADGEAGEADLDPRAELVRQLLQYKAFKDAADKLADAADHRARRFEHPPVRVESEPEEVELDDVGIWDLFEAFSRLLEQIGQEPGRHEVIYDDTPIEVLAEDLLDRLTQGGPLRFAEVFEGAVERSEIVGMFLAMLELARRRRVRIGQESSFGEIVLSLNPDAEAFDAGVSDAPGEVAAPPPAASDGQARSAPASPTEGPCPHESAGQYVPEPAPPQE
jgi:segregation and condensation protein A